MRDGAMLFYGSIVAMICLTGMITNCTFQERTCVESAIKAGVKPNEIKSMCALGR